MTTSANPTLTTIEDLVQGHVWNPLVDLALQSLYTAVPWLRFPVLKLLIDFVAHRYSAKLFALLRLQVDLTAIVFLNKRDQREFTTTVLRLRALAPPPGQPESPEYRKEIEHAKAAFSRFVSFAGN